MTKKIIAVLLVIVTLFSFCAVASSAASYVNINAKYGNEFCTCTLTGNKTAKVTVQVNCGGKPTVTFKDENGRYIWGEDKAISAAGKRTFKLGADHRVYRIYIKDPKPRLMQASMCSFSNPKNCTIK